MATLKYNTSLGTHYQETTISSTYTASAAELIVTDGNVFPTGGDFWVAVGDTDPPDFILKATARGTSTLTNTLTVGTAGDDGTTPATTGTGVKARWVLGPAALTQFKADVRHAKIALATSTTTTTHTSTSTVNDVFSLVTATLTVSDETNAGIMCWGNLWWDYVSGGWAYQGMLFTLNGTTTSQLVAGHNQNSAMSAGFQDSMNGCWFFPAVGAGTHTMALLFQGNGTTTYSCWNPSLFCVLAAT